MQDKEITWVVVADGAKGRLFRNEGPPKAYRLVEIAEFENPHARGHSRDLGSDRPGRSFESVGELRHAMEPRTDLHRQAKIALARRIADYLETAADAHRFQRLIVVAPPPRLGELRSAFGRLAARLVVSEVARDLTHQDKHAIARRLARLA